MRKLLIVRPKLFAKLNIELILISLKLYIQPGRLGQESNKIVEPF
jgi:hypothetical protein